MTYLNERSPYGIKKCEYKYLYYFCGVVFRGQEKPMFWLDTPL